MRRIALGIAALAAFGLAACAPGATASAFVATAEAEALAAMGVDAVDLAVTASADPAPKPDDEQRKKRWDRRHPQKVLLHRNVLHGEAVVQNKDGENVTVAVQRGVVTAIDASSVTVKSSDGFTWTWTFHPELRVIEKRATIQPSEIKAGATIALAGPKPGDQPQARLIVLPMKQA
ncbi:hypothetical protein [Allorhizocola rhizosphaerae]|uniref:hypothetical protein n=1 Tax=Allorhizocola rhizosphaerae TaxID=1872709 RepID=UPI000E3E8A80|nr:hypothetical protein [Allorhizocola rhizosphaerae]